MAVDPYDPERHRLRERARAARDQAERLREQGLQTLRNSVRLTTASFEARDTRWRWRQWRQWLLDFVRSDQEMFSGVCSWCGRIRHGERGWTAVPVPRTALTRFLHGAGMPRVSHGICPGCARRSLESDTDA